MNGSAKNIIDPNLINASKNKMYKKIFKIILKTILISSILIFRNKFIPTKYASNGEINLAVSPMMSDKYQPLANPIKRFMIANSIRNIKE